MRKPAPAPSNFRRARGGGSSRTPARRHDTAQHGTAQAGLAGARWVAASHTHTWLDGEYRLLPWQPDLITWLIKAGVSGAESLHHWHVATRPEGETDRQAGRRARRKIYRPLPYVKSEEITDTLWKKLLPVKYPAGFMNKLGAITCNYNLLLSRSITKITTA